MGRTAYTAMILTSCVGLCGFMIQRFLAGTPRKSMCLRSGEEDLVESELDNSDESVRVSITKFRGEDEANATLMRSRARSVDSILWFSKFVSMLLFFVDSSSAHSLEHLTRCELGALQLGSRLADELNAPVLSDLPTHERINQDFLASNLGFAPWIASGIHGSGGLTLTKSNAASLQAEHGWIGRNISESPYKVLQHKWVYMFGDSTTRQVWASFAAPFQGNNFERNSKEWTRQYCNKQEHRRRHPKGGMFPDEGWGGPCGINEVTCYVSGYGDEGLLTFDWKHFPYEDYDDYVWGESGPWSSKQSTRRPDILTIQTGMHSCWHAHPEGEFSAHLKETNTTLIETHAIAIHKLMKAVRSAIDRPTNASTPTLVVISTSGAVGLLNKAEQYKADGINNCILRFNRIVAEAAHAHGFAVLERGEIERRLLYKSIQFRGPFEIETHLAQPAQNIIATCLLSMFNCLSDAPADLKMFGKFHTKAGAMRPYSTPPIS